MKTPGVPALAGVLLALAGCQSQPVNIVRVDAASVPSKQKVSPNPCGFRLLRVIDGRSASDAAGGLGMNQLKIDDAPALVRSELLKSGLLPAEAAGRDVEVRILHLYLTQNRYTRLPVAVYSVSAQGLQDFPIRAQPSRMVWSSSGDSALSAISQAVHEANTRVMATLNQSCRR
jgi:hypothetical protein